MKSSGKYTEIPEIPAGYRITIKSWENDLNCEATTILEGLVKEQIQYVVELCSLFKRRTKFSNLYEPSSTVQRDLAKTVAEIILRHQPHSYDSEGIVESLVKEAVDSDNYDQLIEFCRDDIFPKYMSSGDSSYPFFTRVCESMKVEYIPETIRILNVTEEFVDTL